MTLLIGSTTQAATDGRALTAKLVQSRLFRDYQLAFESATALRLHLQPIGGEDAGEPTGRQAANVFCQLMAKNKATCATCHSLQQRLELQTAIPSQPLQCFAGLSESAVAVRARGRTIARLETGHILLQRPDAVQFARVVAALQEGGVVQDLDLRELEAAWFASTVLDASRHRAILRLLQVFAGNLSASADALFQEVKNVEPALIAKTKAFVQANLAGELSLSEIAKVVEVSAPYLSALFGRVTGMTFTDYVARERVEKVKGLLADPAEPPITVIVKDTGFNSLSQFNRVFKSVCGVSARAYRAAVRCGRPS